MNNMKISTSLFVFCAILITSTVFSQQRTRVDLNKQWRIFSVAADVDLPDADLSDLPAMEKASQNWYNADMPQQVQDCILEQGELPDPAYGDNVKYWKKVFENDWIYTKEFKSPDTGMMRPEAPGEIELCFDGLDTEVDVFLNGTNIAYCNNMHRRWRIPVKGILAPPGATNELILRFYQPSEVINTFIKEYPDTKVQSLKYIRKCVSDFKSYMGADPPFLKVGIHDNVYLDLLPENYFGDIQVESELGRDFSSASIQVDTDVRPMSKQSIEYRIFDNSGNEVASGWSENPTFSVTIDDPELWYPMNYGAQSLYRIRLKLWEKEQLMDDSEVEFGIRDIQVVQQHKENGQPLFCVQVNGQKIFMNGACWAPLNGITHVWDEAKAETLLRMMVVGNMNFLRIWGAGTIPGKSLFEFCDRNGIVIMMDFMFTAPLRLPTEIPEFSKNINLEIEDVIRRLRNHPSIAFWSGGNEQYLLHKSNLGDNTHPIGREFYQKTIPSIVRKLDPQRYFHPSSPWGGESWINGNHPLYGDYHDYSTFRFQPLSSVPLFTTEVCMVSPYSVTSMRKFMSEDELWPEDFEFKVDVPGKKAWPPGWEHHSLGSAWQKIGNIQDYCDIASAEDACRVFGMAHGQYLKERYERQRRGVPDGHPDTYRRSWGAAVWRLNDSWPIIYMSIVDYYLEPKIPYYYLKRACEPLLISFEQTADRICVWVTNDRAVHFADSLTVELKTFDGTTKRSSSVWVELAPSESRRVMDLTHEFYEIVKRREFIEARMADQVKTHLLWPEKYLRLQNGEINAAYQDGALVLQADTFIKAVEISIPGTTGAVFSDNYFDLPPGTPRHISVMEAKGGKEINIKGLNTEEVVLDL